MDDYGHAQADKEIEKLERRYKKVYGEAARGVREKAEAFFDGFARRDQEQRTLVDAGKLSQRDYRNWRINQMAIGKRWTDFAGTLTDELAHANEIATELVNKRLPGVYALNHNYAAFTIEQGAGMGLNFELYDRRTVERLMKGDPRLLPVKQLDVPKDKRWNTKKIQSVILQGIIQGEDIGTMADRFQAVTDANREAALRNVRTCVTGAENAGRLDGFKSAQRMGIGVKKEWLATLDDRTRASHRLLDGQRADTDKKFSNGLMYPGDPFGPPSEVYNCRCTMIAAIDGVQEVEPVYRRDNLTGERIADMTYQEWYKMKFAQAAAQPVQAAKPLQAAVTGGIMKTAARALQTTDYPDAFTTKREAPYTQKTVDFINGRDGADPNVVELYGSMGRLDNIGANGVPFKISHTADGHALRQSVYVQGGGLADVQLKIPKFVGDDLTGQMGTALHEEAHYIDLLCRPDPRKSGFYSAGNGGLRKAFSASSSTMSEEVSDLFGSHKATYTAIRNAEKAKYTASVKELMDERTKMSSTERYATFEEYKKKRKALERDYVAAVDYQYRNAGGGGIDALMDIYDALSSGSYLDTGIVVSGHGGSYYRSEENRLTETFANYMEISVTRPDLVEMLRRDKPELAAALDETVAEMLRRVKK